MMPKCERRSAALHMSTILLSKAALELLSSRFEHQGVQPACRMVETHTGKQSFKCGEARKKGPCSSNSLAIWNCPKWS